MSILSKQLQNVDDRIAIQQQRNLQPTVKRTARVGTALPSWGTGEDIRDRPRSSGDRRQCPVAAHGGWVLVLDY